MSQGVRVASDPHPTAAADAAIFHNRLLVATVASILHVFHHAHDSLVLLDSLYWGLIDGEMQVGGYRQNNGVDQFTTACSLPYLQ